MNYFGIDGYRAGWLWIKLNDKGHYKFGVCNDAYELIEVIKNSKLTLIDIPIGLISKGSTGRKYESEARIKLGRRACCVFTPPARRTIKAKNYNEACKINLKLTGKKISKQTWAITPKIREIDKFLNDNPKLRKKIRETHPEICFWSLNDQHPMGIKKKSLKGRVERINVLKRYFPNVDEIIEDISKNNRRKEVAWDDINDALVCAIVAKNGHDNLNSLPEVELFDEKNLPMEIVYL